MVIELFLVLQLFTARSFLHLFFLADDYCKDNINIDYEITCGAIMNIGAVVFRYFFAFH